MWLNEIRKAESLAGLGRVEEGVSILARFANEVSEIEPDEDLGLALHRLGSALFRRLKYEDADKALVLAINVRRAVLKICYDDDVCNHLAGSHKMRAVVRLTQLMATGNASLAHAGIREVDEAIRIRSALVERNQATLQGIELSYVHDLAMTLNTKGVLEGTVRNFGVAMIALNEAAKLMRDLVIEDADWREDLGICLVDVALFGVGARAEAGQQFPLEEVDECFKFYQTQLTSELANNPEVQQRFLRFIGHAATPAAVFAKRPDYAKVFLEAGLSLVEQIMADPNSRAKIGDGVGVLFMIPPQALSVIFAAGLDEGRYARLSGHVLTHLKARKG